MVVRSHCGSHLYAYSYKIGNQVINRSRNGKAKLSRSDATTDYYFRKVFTLSVFLHSDQNIIRAKTISVGTVACRLWPTNSLLWVVTQVSASGGASDLKRQGPSVVLQHMFSHRPRLQRDCSEKKRPSFKTWLASDTETDGTSSQGSVRSLQIHQFPLHWCNT